LLLFSEEPAVRHELQPDEYNKDNKNNELSVALYISWYIIHENFEYKTYAMIRSGFVNLLRIFYDKRFAVR
jgi:hypothetical protein